MGTDNWDDGRQHYENHEVPYPPPDDFADGEPRGNHLSRDGDGCMGSNGSTGQAGGDGGGDDDDDDDDEEPHAAITAETTAPDESSTTPAEVSNKKKRKRAKKKKTSAAKQSSPPRIPLDQLFSSGEYPIGELQSYHDAVQSTNVARTVSSELRAEERRRFKDSTYLNNYRKAAEVHRQTRQWAQQTVKPGQKLSDIAVGIEDSVRALLGNAGLEPGDSLRSGLGFPTGLALNNCVAHYTPNPGGREVVLQHQDVMKVDFGVHINGSIVDSAFTMSFDPTYDNLLSAVRDATNTGIKTAGIDVRICDVSAAIQEVMESYEVEIRGKTFPVKAVRNLCGHDIKPYRIHGSKMIPFIKNSDQTKMEEGEVFAIETFGSTGRGFTRDGEGVYGYGLSYNAPKQVSLPLSSANRLYKTIRENFGTIVFCRRYLDRIGCERYLAGLNCLISNGILESYPPLMDIPGSYSAQFEHTILLREYQKEIISRGDDY